MTWYWNSKSVNKYCILPWIHGETKFNCHIKLPISFGEYLFIKMFIIIIANNSKQLISLPNDVKLRTHAIDQPEKDFLMTKNTEIYSVADTIQKLNLQPGFHLIYKQKFYHDKQREMDEIFDEYHLPLLKDIDHPAFIE